MTKLSTIGEFGLINRFSKYFIKGLPVGFTGIGDDCAIIPINKKQALLVTTDMLIEDRHFLKEKIPPFELGNKSLAVNLSDIAAMGGTPESIFLSVGIPPGTQIEWLDEFFKGLEELTAKTNTFLLGGDTTKSPDKLIINITVLGKADVNRIKKRNTAKPGDIICTTDCIGDSAAGLKVLLENIAIDEDTRYLVKRHHLPLPHIDEGKWLSIQKGTHAMIDVSDGIESDIHRIMECSKVGAEINLDNIPISGILQKIAGKNNWNIFEIAVGGGEDYCLMVTLDAGFADKIMKMFEIQFNKPLYPIGSINNTTEKLVFKKNNKKIDFLKHGFDHFKNN